MPATDIESALLAFLEADAGINAVVGARIYPMRATEGSATPFLVYHKVSGPSIHSKDGSMHLAYPRFQVTCWATKYSEAKAGVKAVRAALEAYVGPTMQGINVAQIIVENETDLSDPPTLELGVALDAIIWHTE